MSKAISRTLIPQLYRDCGMPRGPQRLPGAKE
jgi:hypothetical protein